jgi:hypothetical protein
MYLQAMTTFKSLKFSEGLDSNDGTNTKLHLLLSSLKILFHEGSLINPNPHGYGI